ncbi:site-specific DNA-methyltransferase [Butyricimonas faecalis]|jgi:adenine-specific DNA-methyltransferase|uniref:site-specific DNA-methyltransferase (adenine-specific) n=1 Tax=Butyricimonas faecalis TaxID=2093856 RepID=A0A3S9VUV5_9BACT|nr:site-specific DNA-methyltransferase [Butyricimonas faecalis]AZS30347.1 site-specific DNA-methyltransferase [Butyricimonas faecalis]
MDGNSQTPQKERLEALRLLMPEVFDEGYIDWEKLKVALGENVNFTNERYVLNWAGKSEAFRVMQQPSKATLVPCREESVDFDNTQNIFIEGENMEVLKVLQKSYFGKVKMIYIDPPYNTGSDSFIYPDKFSESKEEYLRRVGDKNEEGYMTHDGMFHKNVKENGQYHSNWLNMMMPRLYLAKSLLREDGVIFISIDDNEVHNLRLLMNEIFGEENFVAQFIWEKRITRENRKAISNRCEYVLCYTKSSEGRIGLLPMNEEAKGRYKNPDNDPRGLWTSVPAIAQAGHGTKKQFYTLVTPAGKELLPPSGSCWRYTLVKMQEAINDKRIWFGSDGNGVPRIKKFLHEGKQGLTPETLLTADSVGTNDSAKRELVNLFDGIAVFETPKPITLVAHLINICNVDDGDIVLDFFAGSAPTAHAVMFLNKDGKNRKYICVQMDELCEESSEAYRAGYKTIAEISKERIRRAGAKIRKGIEIEQTKQKGQLSFGEDQTVVMPDLGFKVFKLSDSNFKQWRDIQGSNKEEWQQQILNFLDPITENATIDNMVYELLLKSGKDLNSVIEHKKGYYTINGKDLILMLESATQEVIDSILVEHPNKVIALDRLFEGNDQLKTNTVLQMKDIGVEFKTI